MRSPAAVDHPTWCSTPHCTIRDPRTAEHRSAPVTYRTDSGDVEITVQRIQRGTGGDPIYRVAVVHLEVVEQTVVELTDDDAVMLFSVFGLLRQDATRETRD